MKKCLVRIICACLVVFLNVTPAFAYSSTDGNIQLREKDVVFVNQNEQVPQEIIELAEKLNSMKSQADGALTDEMIALIEDSAKNTVKNFETETNDLINSGNLLEVESGDFVMTAMAAGYTSTVVRNYFVNNYSQAQSILDTYTYLLINVDVFAAIAYRNATFAGLVKSGGAWDLKTKLGRTNYYYINGYYRSGEQIGNEHYGYMGKALGYGSTTLKTVAGLYQIVSGTSDWSFYTSYFDDPADTTAINEGINWYLNGVRF
jgi:hypothetical protein